jgi:hypothetical protein
LDQKAMAVTVGVCAGAAGFRSAENVEQPKGY